MRTIGLIGGLSWHSTLEYYRLVNERVAEVRGGHASARVVMESLDFAEIRECQTSGDWERAGRLLAGAGRRLEASGADVLLICANLMHKVAGDVEAAVDVPSHEDKVEIDRIVFEELTQGRVLDASRAAYVAAIERLRDAGSVALASSCTELELLVGPADSPLPLLESMRIHALAAADWALER